jgi:hypothetical protein
MKTQSKASLTEAGAKIKKHHRHMNLTLAPLQADMDFAVDNLRNDQVRQQFWRRTTIRCLLAYTEALLWNLKHGIPTIATMYGIGLSSSDLEIIEEKRTIAVNGKFEHRTKYLKFRDNLKQTFNLFGKVHRITFNVNCNQDFDDLCTTYELRNRLMHPKIPMDPDVSDLNMAASQQGIKWLGLEYQKLLTECIQSLPNIAKRT